MSYQIACRVERDPSTRKANFGMSGSYVRGADSFKVRFGLLFRGNPTVHQLWKPRLNLGDDLRSSGPRKGSEDNDTGTEGNPGLYVINTWIRRRCGTAPRYQWRTVVAAVRLRGAGSDGATHRLTDGDESAAPAQSHRKAPSYPCASAGRYVTDLATSSPSPAVSASDMNPGARLIPTCDGRCRREIHEK